HRRRRPQRQGHAPLASRRRQSTAFSEKERASLEGNFQGGARPRPHDGATHPWLIYKIPMKGKEEECNRSIGSVGEMRRTFQDVWSLLLTLDRLPRQRIYMPQTFLQSGQHAPP